MNLFTWETVGTATITALLTIFISDGWDYRVFFIFFIIVSHNV